MNGQGNYTPTGADLSYPRTIIDRQEIPQVRISLQDSLKFATYKSLINSANATIPSGNESNGNRAKRAAIAREAAFILLMKKTIIDDQLSPLTATDSLLYLNTSLNLLESLNDSVGSGDGFLFYWEWQLRSNELMNYLIAYDLLKGLDLPDTLLAEAKNKVYQFSGNFYSKTSAFYPNPTISFLPLEFYSYKVNNHAIISCSTLGIAAIVLGDETSTDPNFQPYNWMQAAMYNLDNVLWREGGINPRVSELEKLAGYAEGPNYFWYAFKNTMPFIRSMWNFLPDGYYDYTFSDYNGFSGTSEVVTRNLRNPWYDENYHNLYEWMNRIRMPDGRYPAIHDSGRGFKTMITALSGIARYNIPNSNSNYNSVWERSQFISTLVEKGVYDESLFQALPDAGSLVFRSEYNDPEAVYMHLIGKNGIALFGAKGHHQADATSFQLYFNGEDLALDSGYSGSNYRGDIQKATDHNLILVNGKGPGTPNNEFISFDNATYIENYFDMPSIDYGELRGSWQETDITRKTLFLNNQYFIIADFVKSNNSNDYTFQLHGNGLIGSLASSVSGAFNPDFANQSVTYSRNNSNLLSHITSRGSTNYAHQLDSLSLGANGYHEYSKTLVSENGVNDTEFLSILFPYKGQNQPLVEPILTSDDVIAKKIFSEESKDLIFTQPTNETSLINSSNYSFADDITSNGNINFVSFAQNDKLQSIFIENGSSLSIGDKEYFNSSQLVDVSLDFNVENEILGYINTASIIEIYSDTSYLIDYGNISNIDFIDNKIILTFNDSSYFKLVLGEIPLSTNSIENDFIKMELFPNPTKNNTTVRLENITERMEGELKIFTLTGQLISEEKIDIIEGNNFFPLALNSSSKSIYIIQLTTKNGILTKKLSIY